MKNNPRKACRNTLIILIVLNIACLFYFCFKNQDTADEHDDASFHFDSPDQSETVNFHYTCTQNGFKSAEFKADRIVIKRVGLGHLTINPFIEAVFEKADIRIYAYEKEKNDERLHVLRILDQALMTESFSVFHNKKCLSLKMQPASLTFYDGESNVITISSDYALYHMNDNSLVFRGNATIKTGGATIASDYFSFNPEMMQIKTHHEYVMSVSHGMIKSQYLTADIAMIPNLLKPRLNKILYERWQ